MLRSEHVMARLGKGRRVIPHSLSPINDRALAVAETLCDLYASHEGRPRRLLEEELVALEEELGPGLDPRRGFRIVRALAKLLEEWATWVPPTSADPYTIRTRLFELASALPEPPAAEAGLLGAPTREDVLWRVSAETGIEDPAALMYADRQGAQLLGEFERPSPQKLIGRYNVAQVQGVLYSSRELSVDLGRAADARLVFHYVKLMDLIYRLETTPEGYRLHLDGPLSIFGATRKYGVRLAKFLPGLLLTAPWKLSASVEWREREAVLELDSESCGLRSHYSGPRELREAADVRGAFLRAWQRAKETGGWKLEAAADVLPIPEKKVALVPDFTLKHPSSGRIAHLEILGFWSERHLIDRVALIREGARRGHRLLLAASENLGTSAEALSGAAGSGEVVPFKNRLNAKVVIEALEAASGSGAPAG